MAGVAIHIFIENLIASRLGEGDCTVPCIRNQRTLQMMINEIINTLEKAMRMEPDVKRLSQEVSAGNDASQHVTVGINRTLTRLRLADAEKALAEKRAELEAVYATLPPKESIPYAEFCRTVARNRMRQSDLEAEKVAAEADLVATQQAGKGNEWKWKARGDPPLVAIARKKIADIETQLAELATRTIEEEAYVREETEFEDYTAELAAWTPDKRLPERFRRAVSDEISQMDFVAIPLRRRPNQIPKIVISEIEG